MSKVEKWKSGKPRYKFKKNTPYLHIIRIKVLSLHPETSRVAFLPTNQPRFVGNGGKMM